MAAAAADLTLASAVLSETAASGGFGSGLHGHGDFAGLFLQFHTGLCHHCSLGNHRCFGNSSGLLYSLHLVLGNRTSLFFVDLRHFCAGDGSGLLFSHHLVLGGLTSLFFVNSLHGCASDVSSLGFRLDLVFGNIDGFSLFLGHMSRSLDGLLFRRHDDHLSVTHLSGKVSFLAELRLRNGSESGLVASAAGWCGGREVAASIIVELSGPRLSNARTPLA